MLAHYRVSHPPWRYPGQAVSAATQHNSPQHTQAPFDQTLAAKSASKVARRIPIARCSWEAAQDCLTS